MLLSLRIEILYAFEPLRIGDANRVSVIWKMMLRPCRPYRPSFEIELKTTSVGKTARDADADDLIAARAV